MLDLLIQRGARTGDLQDPDTARLNQQVSNLIHRGLVVSVDLQNAVATVHVGEVQTAALPWLTTRAGGDITWWAPEAGEHVAILCPSGSLSQGVIIGSLYCGANPAPSNSADQNITKCTTQAEASEAAPLFDLAEDRFHDGLPRFVDRSPASVRSLCSIACITEASSGGGPLATSLVSPCFSRPVAMWRSMPAARSPVTLSALH